MNNSLRIPLWLLFFLGFTLSCGNETTTDSTVKAAAPETMTNMETSVTEVKKPKKRIIFFGDSLTAGYGLDEQDSYPSLVQNILDSLGLNYQAVNAGLSGETTAGGVNRIDWVAEQPMDIFVLELGGNDVLRGFDLATTRTNLQEIVDKVKAKYPDVKLVIAGMEAPPNMGAAYGKEFRGIFKEIAQTNDAVLIPFLLADVGGIPELNLADRIHPNQEGQKIVARNVWAVLEGLVEKES